MIRSACKSISLAKGEIVGWIRDCVEARDWARAMRLINLAVHLAPDGLGPLLTGLLDADIRELNQEDIVEIPGELGERGARRSLVAVIERSRESDTPAYWLTQKAIFSLADLQSADADADLRRLTGPGWPKLVRWHAAVALGVAETLGFTEAERLLSSPA